MIDNQEIHNQFKQIIVSYLNGFNAKDKSDIFSALHILFARKYDFNNFSPSLQLDYEKTQNALYSLNEKTLQRKNTGVYYTPADVCKYIIYNSIIASLSEDNGKIYGESDAIEFILKYKEKLKDIIFHKSFFDPTCGSGEFLINLFKIKFDLLKKINPVVADDDILKITQTIFGNDILEESTDISKTRLFFEIIQTLKSKKYYPLVAKSLNRQFSNCDYILYNGKFNDKFDFILGNPPYVEYGKFNDKTNLSNRYGNVYADVIKNSLNSLKPSGILGFIIPISYISTPRMNLIRNYVYENTSRQYILSYADRPDCLFSSVHQKLNILIAQRGNQNCQVFTSNYKYWYKEERNSLFSTLQLTKNKHAHDKYITKIENEIEESIFKKVFTEKDNSILDLQSESGKNLYLNMRATFWIKAFSHNPGSKEYKAFVFDEQHYYFALCVLNSSLFWLYWNICSDCWHITSKELKSFYMPKIDEVTAAELKNLATKLESELERTKKFIGSKQTQYEYKHKDCKKIIDKIDDVLAKIYSLTEKEFDYVKNFALKYRMGGAND